MSFSLGLNQNSASIGAGGDNNLLPYYPSDSMGSARIIKRSQKDDESNSKIGQNSSYNDGGAVREEKKSEHNIYNQEEKKLYIEEIKNQKFNYTLKSEEDKVQYIKECDDYFVKLQNYHSWFKSSLISKEEVQVNLKQRPEVLSKWGPKRCRIYLKLASLYYIINDESMKNELITKATEDLNEMDDVEDKSEVSECRRWLCLQKIESHMNNENQEAKLLERCWNVKQRHFEGRRDFLDFYTLFLAKHLLRKGDYKKAKSAHQDALVLRRQRKEFSEQDDFDWDKIETEVKNQLEDKIK